MAPVEAAHAAAGAVVDAVRAAAQLEPPRQQRPSPERDGRRTEGAPRAAANLRPVRRPRSSERLPARNRPARAAPQAPPSMGGSLPAQSNRGSDPEIADDAASERAPSLRQSASVASISPRDNAAQARSLRASASQVELREMRPTLTGGVQLGPATNLAAMPLPFAMPTGAPATRTPAPGVSPQGAAGPRPVAVSPAPRGMIPQPLNPAAYGIPPPAGVGGSRQTGQQRTGPPRPQLVAPSGSQQAPGAPTPMMMPQPTPQPGPSPGYGDGPTYGGGGAGYGEAPGYGEAAPRGGRARPARRAPQGPSTYNV